MCGYATEHSAAVPWLFEKLCKAGAEMATFTHLNFCEPLALLGVCSDEVVKGLGFFPCHISLHFFIRAGPVLLQNTMSSWCIGRLALWML